MIFIKINKTRSWLNKNSKKRFNQPAIYSRPTALTGSRREELFDGIRQYLENLPVIIFCIT
jgi:hypothetical protein